MSRITNQIARWMGRHWVLTAMLTLPVVGYIGYLSVPQKATTGGSSPTGITARPAPAPTPQETKQDAVDESALFGAIELRRSMRNPGSFRLAQVLTMADGAVCFTYRAQNGFGGMNVGFAVLTPAGKLETNEMRGFHALWNKECANKTGQDRTWMIEHNMEALRAIK